MSGPVQFENPEPVPGVSQLCALPFVAAVEGYLAGTCRLPQTRATLHRVLTRDGTAYLQQLCSYAGQSLDHQLAGRIFSSTTGIIGKSFSECEIIRTRHHDNEEQWWLNYRLDRKEVKDTGSAVQQVLSYLAVPLLNPFGDAVVCVLYVEAGGLNVFTSDNRLEAILGMCGGFCRVFDGLEAKLLPRVRNYPLPPGRPHLANVTAYPRLQEAIQNPSPPRFNLLTSFNFAPSP